jgi:plastocyanin domain-containing protein
MKNTTLFLIGAIILVLIVGFVFVNTLRQNQGNNQTTNSEVQIVKLSVVGSQYIFSPSEIKKGIPVRLEADMANMPGCSKSVVIAGFGISKTFTSSDNTIEFTPDKAGVFNIACSMNMYRGSFSVLEIDGSRATYVENKSTSTNAGTCSMGSKDGSCGCGMMG